ncbi:MAG: hypothetical protein ABI383_15965 [Acidobacteriaceae bacterium]
MAKAKLFQPFELSCPCCGALMVIDPETHGVISHTPPPTKRMFENFDAAANALKGEETRRESLFRQSMEAEKNKSSLLDKKFQDAMKKAKDAPNERPLRDFDLD